MTTPRVLAYILTGATFLRTDIYPQWALWLLIIGAPLFGLGAAAGSAQVIVRSVGIVLLAGGMIRVGVFLWKV